MGYGFRRTAKDVARSLLSLKMLVEDHGGEGGIRTPDTRQGMAAFEAARFNHSRTSPHQQQRIVGPSTRSPAATSLRISAAGSDARKAPQLSRRLVSTTHAPLRISSNELWVLRLGRLLRPRSGFRLRARTPAKRLNFRGGSFQPLTHLSASAATNCGSFDSVACCDLAQDFGCGLGRPQSASTFEAARFNHSRTSPHQQQRIVGPSTRSPAATSLRISAAGSDARKAPQLSRRLVSTTHAPLRISGKRIVGPLD